MIVTSSSGCFCPTRINPERLRDILRRPIPTFPFCFCPVPFPVFVSPVQQIVVPTCPPCPTIPVVVSPVQQIVVPTCPPCPTISPTIAAGISEVLFPTPTPTPIPIIVSPVSGVVSTTIIQGCPTGVPSVKTLNTIMRNPILGPCRCIPQTV